MITPGLPSPLQGCSELGLLSGVRLASFWGQPQLPQYCSSWGCPRMSLCQGCAASLAQGWLPTARSLLWHHPGIAHEVSLSHQSCPVANSQRACGGFELPVAPMWASLAGLRVAELRWGLLGMRTALAQPLQSPQTPRL